MAERVWLLAGEASGDVLGGRLMPALKQLRPSIEFSGVGGARMQAEGLASLFPMRDLAVMGLAEVLPRVLALRRRLDQAVAHIEAVRPHLILTIDSPGFALRLLARVARLGIPRVHYVAPQVWAWREHRVREFPGLWDMLLCLLPFEPEFFARHGVPARFVGHPVLQSGADRGDAVQFRKRHGVAADAPVLVLMPGSRRNEVPRLLPVFGRTLEILAQQFPLLAAVVPTPATVAETVREVAGAWRVKPIVLTDIGEKHDAYAAAGAALTKSGTSTLELALARVPMAVTYRVNPVSAAIARRLIRVPHVAMVNLLAGRALVPELLQQDCTPARLAGIVAQLLTDAQVGMTQREGFGAVLESLRPIGGDPSQAAARAVADLL